MFTNTSSVQVSRAVWTKHYQMNIWHKRGWTVWCARSIEGTIQTIIMTLLIRVMGDRIVNLSMFYSHHLPAGAAGVKKCEIFWWNSHFDVKGNLGGSWATRHNKTQHKRTQLNTKEHNTTQSNTMQQNTTQHLKGMVGREPGCWHSCQPH